MKKKFLSFVGITFLISCHPQKTEGNVQENTSSSKIASSSSSSRTSSSSQKEITPIPQGKKVTPYPYLNILMFHDIIPDDYPQECIVPDDVKVSTFIEFLNWVEKEKIQTIHSFDIHNLYANGKLLENSFKTPTIMLTFDDNYYGVYKYAIDEMAKRNIKATIFTHTKYVRGENATKENNCKSRAKASWKEMVEAETQKGSGKLFRFESHTHSHPNADGSLLNDLSHQEILFEFKESKKLLEENFKKILDEKGVLYKNVAIFASLDEKGNKKVLHLAYPRGSYGENVARALLELDKQGVYKFGYEVGFEYDYTEPKYAIGRTGIGIKLSLEEIKKKALGK